MIRHLFRTPNLHVTALEQPADERWDAELEAAGQPFRFSHRAGAGRAFEAAFASYRFIPCQVQYSDGAAALFPIVRMERRLGPLSMALGMPLGLEGTPIALQGELTARHVELLLAVLDRCGALNLSGGAGGSPPALGSTTEEVTHVLDLTCGYDQLWRRSFTDRTRNMCRKAQRAGLEVAAQSGERAVDAYYDLYARNSVQRGYASPPYPRRLFHALLATGAAELWSARVNGELIAGAVLLRGSEDLLYWSGAMDRERRSAAPSNAVIRAAIESACERGYAYFDFGSSNGLPGVEAFKRSFGAAAKPYTTISLSSWPYRRIDRATRAIGLVHQQARARA